MNHLISRRQVLLGGTAAAAAASLLSEPLFGEQPGASVTPLEELGYEQVALRGAAQVAQRENVASILMGFSDDSLLKPYREMAGKPGPGASLGGWYEWKPNYDYHHDDAGLAPGSSFGQWMSALARLDTAARFGGAAGDGAMAERVVRLNGLLGETIDKTFFEQTRFPGYTYDKLTCGLMDAHRLLGDKAAFATLNRVADAAVPSFTGHVIERDIQWKVGYDPSWIWDEVYTIPENQYLVWKMGAGDRYKRLAEQTRDDKTLFEPLSRGVNVLGDRHAYSHVNCLCSAMQAYLSDGSAMHFEAAKNGFSIVEQQSFATGGWGPEELLRKPGYDEVFKSLAASRNSFETPCGAYAHMKLTRYLLRATRDGHFGDSMEKVMLNTVLGSLPLQPDGRSFYSSDYSTVGKRIYSQHRWPCCSGTLPQVVADLRHQHLPPGAWRVVGQPLPTVGGALDGGWKILCCRADRNLSGGRRGTAQGIGVVAGILRPQAARSGMGCRRRSPAGEWKAAADQPATGFCHGGTPLAHGRSAGVISPHVAAARTPAWAS